MSRTGNNVLVLDQPLESVMLVYANDTIQWIRVNITADFADTSALADVSTLSNTVDDSNETTNLSLWTGTQAEYDALTTRDPRTLYFTR